MELVDNGVVEKDGIRPKIVNNESSSSSDAQINLCSEKIKISDSCSNIIRKIVMLVLSILIFFFRCRLFGSLL